MTTGSAGSPGGGPIRGHVIGEALLGPDGSAGLWTSIRTVASTGSTNADLLARGGPEGQVLVAEEQTAGRGRAGRRWVSQPGASLTFSVLLRPASVPPSARGWLPLLTGVAVAAGVRSASGVEARLKWPNDVLVGDRKLAGILAEQSPDGDAVVVGVGLNVATSERALPASPTGLPATSLLVEGADVAREALLAEILRSLGHWYLRFSADPDPVSSGLLAEYRAACATLGRQVRVELPASRVLAGLAEDVDASGRLLVRPADAASATAVSAGDVVHLRLESGESSHRVAVIYVDRIYVDPIYIDPIYLSVSPGWRGEVLRCRVWVVTDRWRWAKSPSRFCIRTGRRWRGRSWSRS